VLGWGALQPRALWHALRQMKRADQQPMPQSSKLRTDTGTTDNR